MNSNGQQASRKQGPAVAIGGGLPFGVVALGLLRLLEEKNIRVKAISGTSLGAIVGALYSIHQDAEKVTALLDSFFDRIDARKLMLRDLGLFKAGILRGKRLMRRVEELLGGDFLLEEAAIPLMVNATDLVRGRPVILRTGSALDAIRASIAMPGIFTPYAWQDTYLVDGAITCPICIAPLIEEGYDPVIPVRALRSLPDENEVERERRRIEKDHSLQFGKAPGIIYVLWRATGLIQQDDFARRIMSDHPYAVAPEISMEMSGDLHRVRELVDSGYEAALRAWPRLACGLEEAGA